MQVVELQKRPVDVASMKIVRRPLPSDYNLVIDRDAVVVDQAGDGEPAVVFLSQLDRDHSPLIGALRRLPFRTYTKTSKGGRTSGLKNVAACTFGALQRIAIRRDYCTQSEIHKTHPEFNHYFAEWAGYCGEHYARHAPVRYARQREMVQAVLPTWRFGETGFTSGIVNRDNPLAYHHDAGNFKGVWSAMLAFQRDMDGGLLVIPEYRVAFRFGAASMIMFNGADLLHGVSPLKRRSSLAYRYTVVYYALRGLCKCGTPEQELARIKTVKTGRELSRLDPEQVAARTANRGRGLKRRGA